MAETGTAEIALAQARRAFWVMVAVLAVVWAVQVANWSADYRLSLEYGIRPRDRDSLAEVATAPFLHFSWVHLEGNSGPLFIFGFLAAYRGVGRFLGLTALVVLASGLGAWATATAGTVGAGASGVVFGYFGYVLVKGAFDRHLVDVVVGLVMALCFAYQFVGLLPREGIGWQAHLFGFLGGIVGGWLFRQRRSPAASGADPLPPSPGKQPGAQSATPSDRSALLKELDDLGL